MLTAGRPADTQHPAWVRDMNVALLLVSFLWQFAERMYYAQFQETIYA